MVRVGDIQASEATIKAIADHGAAFMGANILHLKGGTRDHFMRFVERDFPLGPTTLGLRAEVFNLTNHANVVGYNGVFGNNASGVPLSTFGVPLGEGSVTRL